jgi:hypothetical protein
MSFVDDEGYCDIPDHVLNRQNSKRNSMSKYMHTTTDGINMRIRDMSKDHILNLIRSMTRYHSEKVGFNLEPWEIACFHPKMDYLLKLMDQERED